MNILIVTNQLIKEENGEFFCIDNLYDILERFSRIGTLHICACKYSGKSSNVIDKSILDLIDSHNIRFVKKAFIKSSSHSNEVIDECVKKVNLVIGYLPDTNASLACKYAKKYNKKYMGYIVSSPWGVLWNHGLLGKFLAPYSFFELRRTLKRADYALYVTENYLQKLYPCSGLTCGCSDVKINFLEDSILNSRLQIIKKLTDNDSLKIATIANNSVRYKGQHFVIKALAQLKKRGVTKFHYHLIGSGDKSYLEKLSKKLGVAELVHFEGIVPHSKIFEKMDEMHIYVQPSLTEGHPRSVVEAMSRGLLCICADVGAMPEMVESEYIVKRKSVDDIVNVLANISINQLINQAKRNFEEAKKYEETNLDHIRNDFFKKIETECEKNNV